MRMLSKRAMVCAAAAIAVVVCGFLAVNAISPVWTSRSMIRAAKVWELHWPFARGTFAPYRLIGLLYTAGVMKPVQVEIRPGAVFELDARDLVTREILGFGVWEPPVTQAVIENLRAGSVMIDVGAHVGYYSILSSTIVGPNGRVVAVEPNPPTLLRLRKNLLLSKTSNVDVEAVACTDKETTLQFFEANLWNTGMSSLSEENAKRSHNQNSAPSVMVRGRPLDDIVRDLGLKRVDLVKIDVEGAEVQVIRGMKEIMATFHPVILLEMAAPHLANMGTSIEELRALLHERGYTKNKQLDDVDYEWTR